VSLLFSFVEEVDLDFVIEELDELILGNQENLPDFSDGSNLSDFLDLSDLSDSSVLNLLALSTLSRLSGLSTSLDLFILSD